MSGKSDRRRRGTSDKVVDSVEMRRLKNNGHGQDTGNDSWKTYVIRNKRTNKIAEIKAASSIHACNLIGWRSRHVSVLEIK